MGFGVSDSIAIISPGVLIATGTLYTATSNTSENVFEVQDADAEWAPEQTGTGIAVTGATYDMNGMSLTANLTNIGSETLSVSGTTLLVDNAYVGMPSVNASIDGDAGTDLWYAGKNLSLIVSADPTPERVKVVTGSGVTVTEAVGQMTDTSVPSLILFIASIIVAAGVSGVLIDTVTGINSSLDEHGGDINTEVRIDIEVISGPQADVYDGGSDNLSIYVKNIGLRMFPMASGGFDTIVDGQCQTNVMVNVVDGTEQRPSNVIELTVMDITLSLGDHRMTIVVGDDEEVFEFHVP